MPLSARRHASPASAAPASSLVAAAASPPAMAAASAERTAPSAAWFPPAAAMNCATSRVGTRAPSSECSRPIVHSSPARAHVAASSPPGAPSALMPSMNGAPSAATPCGARGCVASSPLVPSMRVHVMPRTSIAC
eukprot:4406288-Pleurochrysis_carterae.AAC.2